MYAMRPGVPKGAQPPFAGFGTSPNLSGGWVGQKAMVECGRALQRGAASWRGETTYTASSHTVVGATLIEALPGMVMEKHADWTPVPYWMDERPSKGLYERSLGRAGQCLGPFREPPPERLRQSARCVPWASAGAPCRSARLSPHLPESCPDQGSQQIRFPGPPSPVCHQLGVWDQGGRVGQKAMIASSSEEPASRAWGVSLPRVHDRRCRRSASMHEGADP